VPLETEIPEDGKSNRSGSGAKVHLGLMKGSFRERHQKKENERFLKVYFDKNKYY